MVQRTCPACGTELYSADAAHPWKCPKCGGGTPGDTGEKVAPKPAPEVELTCPNCGETMRAMEGCPWECGCGMIVYPKGYDKTRDRRNDLYADIIRQRTAAEAAQYLADECRKKDAEIRQLSGDISELQRERHYLRGLLDKSIAECDRKGRQLKNIMVDLDKMRQDGDKMAAVLSKALGKRDWYVRVLRAITDMEPSYLKTGNDGSFLVCERCADIIAMAREALRDEE